MGRRGPAPKPTSLRLLHGDRPARINYAEPVPRELPAERPAWLSADAAEEWDRIVPELEHMRVIRAVDSMVVAAYCEAVARFRQASAIVAAEGLLIEVDGTARKHPAALIARDASADMRLLGRELGLSPSARSMLRAGAESPHGGPERLLTS